MQQLPALFGKYELEKFLGGGMSHVYRAKDTVLGRIVAVKILTPEGCRDEDAKKRFLLEARTSASIVHDNIIRIHDYGEIDGRPFIVMEFLTGEDLRTAIDQGRAGDLKRRLDIAIQAARAIVHVHSLNIIHRDLKPENLHIDKTGRVRLMDFGIAKAPNFSMTREGFALGTPYYMAPEQVLGKPVTTAADIYAFGIVLYELLTGVKPVKGETIESLFYLILNQPLDLEPLKANGVPSRLIELISRCTAKKPEERPAGMQQVLAELEAIQRALEAPPQQPSVASPPAQQRQVPQRTRRLSPYVAAAAALAIAAGVLAVFLLRTAPQTPQGDASGASPTPVQPAPAPPPRIADEHGEMILIPAGKFLFGRSNVEMELPAFYMDKTEVSVGQFNRFLQAMGRPLRTDAPDNLPITNVTFDEANAYARWAGKRIPSDEEWEKAARGTDGRIYPWGNEPDPRKANVSNNPDLRRRALQPVDSMPEGQSPYGLLHMAGNAWEWLAESRRPTPQHLKLFAAFGATADDPWTVIRGGGFDFDLNGAVAYEESTVPYKLKGPAIGFRCVRELKP